MCEPDGSSNLVFELRLAEDVGCGEVVQNGSMSSKEDEEEMLPNAPGLQISFFLQIKS